MTSVGAALGFAALTIATWFEEYRAAKTRAPDGAASATGVAGSVTVVETAALAGSTTAIPRAIATKRLEPATTGFPCGFLPTGIGVPAVSELPIAYGTMLPPTVSTTYAVEPATATPDGANESDEHGDRPDAPTTQISPLEAPARCTATTFPPPAASATAPESAAALRGASVLALSVVTVWPSARKSFPPLTTTARGPAGSDVEAIGSSVAGDRICTAPAGVAATSAGPEPASETRSVAAGEASGPTGTFVMVVVLVVGDVVVVCAVVLDWAALLPPPPDARTITATTTPMTASAPTIIQSGLTFLILTPGSCSCPSALTASVRTKLGFSTAGCFASGGTVSASSGASDFDPGLGSGSGSLGALS